MKKIRNPFIERKEFGCFGCDPENDIGLHMEFFEEGDYLFSKWDPADCYQGYINVLHGGIQATLQDELASWVVYVKAGTGGVTSSMEIFYKKPVFVNQGILTVKGRIISLKKRIAEIQTQLFNSENEVCSEANVKYFIYPKDVAVEKLNYPGREAFYYEL